jgi:hypothetical protein
MTPEFDPYKTFTQDNVFTPATEKVLPQETLRKIGMTLDQIGGFIQTYGVKAEVYHAFDSSVDQFRMLAKQYLSTPGHHVIVNYLRKSIGQEKGGHISPLAAYDTELRPAGREVKHPLGANTTSEPLEVLPKLQFNADATALGNLRFAASISPQLC